MWKSVILFFCFCFSLPLFAAQHLISIAATTPFPSSVTASSTTTAVYTVTNVSSIPLVVEDQTTMHNGLPSSVTITTNTCGSLLSPNGTCTLSLTLTAQSSSATQILGTLYEWASPSLDAVTANFGPITVRPISSTYWTFESGTENLAQPGVYGTKGVAATSNIPGGRQNAISWIDSDGIFWLSGGYGVDSLGRQGFLNDLWKFDGSEWAWVSGANTVNQAGTYGTQGVASTSNIPGARNASISWRDGSNNLWLFGGYGYDSVGSRGFLNDLWKFDGSEWTWVSGSQFMNQAGTYGSSHGTLGGVPGSREYAISWIDSNGNLWLFGGEGYDSSGTPGELNDLWKFDGSEWTWVSGSNTVNQRGTYGSSTGTQGTPGARDSSISWIDSSGNLWLFGGHGYDGSGSVGFLNDLWKFDGSAWTWVSGAKTVNQKGTYGTQGIADILNVPGARGNAISWIDGNNYLWLFGGYGYDSSGTTGELNDLWKFDGSEWTWVRGSKLVNAQGNYGTQGTAAASNVVGARDSAISWIDSSGNLWLFGGYGYNNSSSADLLNDLWMRPNSG